MANYYLHLFQNDIRFDFHENSGFAQHDFGHMHEEIRTLSTEYGIILSPATHPNYEELSLLQSKNCSIAWTTCKCPICPWKWHPLEMCLIHLNGSMY